MKSHPKFHFNNSNSDNFIVCVIAEKSAGIDIEKIELTDYKEISEKLFSEIEIDYVLKKDKSTELDRFYGV